MLRLVHPASAGNERTPPPRRRGFPAVSLSLTEEEARHVRAAIRGAARTYGSLRRLAEALGVEPGVLTKKSLPHPGLALALARVTKLSLDAMLAGKLTDAGTCHACGAPKGAFGGTTSSHASQRGSDPNRSTP